MNNFRITSDLQKSLKDNSQFSYIHYCVSPNVNAVITIIHAKKRNQYRHTSVNSRFYSVSPAISLISFSFKNPIQDTLHLVCVLSLLFVSQSYIVSHHPDTGKEVINCFVECTSTWVFLIVFLWLDWVCEFG